MPQCGACAAKGLVTLDKLRLARAHTFAAAADFIQMGALHRGIGVAGEARKKFFHEFDPSCAREAKRIRCDFFDGEGHAAKMLRVA